MTTKKKVLFLITKATWGGAQRYTYDLATNLPKNEFESIVAYGTHGKLAEDLARAGIKAHRIPPLGRNIAVISDIRSFFGLYAYFKETRPDIVHLNSSKAAGLGALAARLAGIRKIIFTVHGWPFKEARAPLARALIYLISWITALLSDRIIVVSKIDAEHARRMWGIRQKTVYVQLGIDRISLLPPSEGFAKLFGTQAPMQLRTETRRLITIGELTPNKGIRYAIDAVAELTRRGIDCVYVIAGDGEERAFLERYAADKGVGERVHFSGFVHDVAKCLASFDVFILPSLKEGTPYVLLEAGTAGIPIVATSVVDISLRERFKHMKYVPAKDKDAIADAVIELSAIPRTSAPSDHFSVSDMVQRTIFLYH